MVLGFNHNLKYKGEVFHVQTEDSGVANPHIITLLYRGGVIICSKKTSYSDILKMDNLEVVVEELMKEQHKDMMRRLKSGEFDEKAFSIKAQLIENYEIPSPRPESIPAADLFAPSSASRPSGKGDISMLFEMPLQKTGPAPAQPVHKPKPDNSQKDINLDDAILSFFGNNDKKP
ncbi:MAG: hypothetical protein A2X82_05165 [Geobacteraceae bacterium GWC2_55_20]|nr:MAG: hypothetical protein A2X82_05165 [Geobacteraceae bacterium GWC2_55_20]OGU24821.1 MAG: hypothetical protein A2X85_03420 [Geobacteraceae bacterium GWF2_54_21]HBA71347.1 hypothetical protein [Geobacter sp.]HCE65992.1 hypothetical protein [Geobacter sp.]